MGEAYLDWQKKSGGIKLNDVIEEYRYVAAGKAVKKGDLLTYVGEDVAPAIEPPFNAVALSSGVGGTDTEHNEQVKIARLQIEIIKAGNIFAKNWTEVSETECTADDGSKLTASSSHSSSLSVYSACDGNVGTYWYANQTHTNTQLSEVLIELPNPCKITKMKTYITTNDDDGNVGKYFGYATIKGTKGNGEWVDLYTIGAVQTELTEISLENADEYINYKIEISTTAITKYVRPRIYEWQTSEYVEVI